MTKGINNKSFPTFKGVSGNGRYESSNPDGDVVLTLSGSGFGGAPTILLWMPTTGKGDGQPALVDDPVIGSFDAISVAQPKYYALDGIAGMSGSEGGTTSATNGRAGFILNFPASTEYFARYSMGVNSAAGRTFSGSSTPYVMPTDSAIKCLWFFSGAPDSPTEPDIVIGSWTAVNFAILGNQSVTNINIGSQFTFDKYNSIACYQKAGNDPVNDNGTTIASLSTPDTGTSIFTETDKPIFPNTGTPSYDYLTFQGWKGNGNQDLTLNLYKDLYVAIGDNSGSRVELGDDALYANCGEPVVAPHSIWSDTNYVSLPISTKLRKNKTHWFQFVDGIQVNSGLIEDNI